MPSSIRGIIGPVFSRTGFGICFSGIANEGLRARRACASSVGGGGYGKTRTSGGRLSLRRIFGRVFSSCRSARPG
jgi:hypothetical protein